MNWFKLLKCKNSEKTEQYTGDLVADITFLQDLDQMTNQ